MYSGVRSEANGSRQTKTTAVERALIEYLDEHDRQKAILEEAEAEK